MIELKNVKISLDKESPNYNVSINPGISKFDHTNKNIFEFLNLKNQVLVDGTFSINDTVYSTDEGNNLLAFKINSQVFSTLCVFQFSKEFTFKTMRAFKKQLITLREVNIETEEGKKEKIDKIFDIIQTYKPLYITIDLNDKTNKVLMNYVKEKLDAVKEFVEYILLLNEAPEVKDMGDNVEEVFLDDISENIEVNESEPRVYEETDVSVETVYEGDNVVEEAKVEESVENESNEVATKTAINREETDTTIDDSVIEEVHEIKVEASTPTPIPASNRKASNNEYQDITHEFKDFDTDFKTPLVKKNKKGEEVETFFGKLYKNERINYVMRFLRSTYVYLLFSLVFNIVIGFCSLTTIYLFRTNNAGFASILLVLIIVFLTLDIYVIGSTYAGLEHKSDTKAKQILNVSIYFVLHLIGYGLGSLLAYLINLTGVFISFADFVPADLSLFLVLFIGSLIYCVFAKYIGKLYKIFEREVKSIKKSKK